MKPALLLPIAIALILAGSVVAWWRVPPGQAGGPRVAVGLLMIQQCVDDADGGKPACTFNDQDPTLLATARHWAFLVGVVASALLIVLRAAPLGSPLRRHAASLSVAATAGALTLGLAVLCGLIYVGVEARSGYPGLGGGLFIAGAILGLRTARLLVVAEQAAAAPAA